MSGKRRATRAQQTKQAAFAAAVNGDGAQDDDAKRKAVMDVVQVWLDRLQLVSVIVSPRACRCGEHG